MDNNKIKNLVVPRMFEQVGKQIINKKSALGFGKSYIASKSVALNSLKTISEAFDELPRQEKFNVDQFITSVSTSHIFNMIKSLVETSVDSNCEQTIVESMNKASTLLIRNFK